MNDSTQESPLIAVLEIEMPLEEAPSPQAGTVKLARVQDTSPKLQNAIFLYAGTAYRVGRDPLANDLVLNSDRVSRFHAIFSASESGVVISDLSSTNGTFVDGQPVNIPVALKTGQEIEIGETKIRIDLSVGEAKPSATTLEHTRAGEMKREQITLLVADVCNYSKISNSLPTDDVTQMLSLWLETVSGVIRKHQGHVDKYMGDCVMALWHGPDKNAEEIASQAVQAALEIKKVTKELSKSDKWGYHNEHRWGCRISLNTGMTLMGTIGGGGARDYTVLGNTVNVAFRLNHVGAEHGQDVILSASTADLVRDAFVLEELGIIEVKDYGKLLAYALLGETVCNGV